MSRNNNDEMFGFHIEGWPALLFIVLGILLLACSVVFLSECKLKEERIQVQQMAACTKMCAARGVSKFNGNGCECK